MRFFLSLFTYLFRVFSQVAGLVHGRRGCRRRLGVRLLPEGLALGDDLGALGLSLGVRGRGVVLGTLGEVLVLVFGVDLVKEKVRKREEKYVFF